jgi:hypothetical protein
VLVDCDGGGGPSSNSRLSRTAYVDQLTPAEQRALCTWAIAAEGGAREYACEVGSGSVYSVDKCAASLADNPPHCQVAVVEDCVNSVHGDPCQLLVTPACKTYVLCVQGRD